MEFLLQLFPEDSGVRVDSYNYVMDTVRTAPAAPSGKTPAPEFSGLTRSWQIKGLVKPKAMELLSSINSQRGVSAFFDKLATAAGTAALGCCSGAGTESVMAVRIGGNKTLDHASVGRKGASMASPF